MILIDLSNNIYRSREIDLWLEHNKLEDIVSYKKVIFVDKLIGIFFINEIDAIAFRLAFRL